MARKKVHFRYDSEEKTIYMSFKNNLIITNEIKDDEGKIITPERARTVPIYDTNLLGFGTEDYDGIILTAAKECLTEMLDLVNARIEECNKQ